MRFKNRRKFFFIRFLDAHIYIELFRIIKLCIKLKPKIRFTPAREWGLNQDKRKEDLIVSLACYPDRINYVSTTIETLLQQSVKPDKLILWLAETQFPNKEKDLPVSLLRLCEFGLEIKWCEDLKSYKKLVPALREYPEAIIVTADDDLYYQSDWLESLYVEYLKNPEHIYTRRATYIELKKNVGNLYSHYSNKNYKPTYGNQLMGGAGTLYPPHSLHQDVFNEDLIKSLIPTHDDIYFWAMAVLNNKKIGLVKNRDVNLIPVEGTQQYGLCKTNNKNSIGIITREAYSRIFNKYPILEEFLKNKN